MSERIRKFQLRKGEFLIQFQLLQDQIQIMIVRLTCEQSFFLYELEIDQQYIKNNSDMSTLFHSPKDLMYTLQQIKKYIDADFQGNITIKIELNAACINLTKIYIFKLNLSLNIQSYLRKRLKDQKEELKVQIKAKQAEIQKIIQQKQALHNQVNMLKKQKQSQKFQINSLLEQINNLQQIISNLKQKLNRNEQQNFKINHQVQISKQKIQNLQNKIIQANNRENNTNIFSKKIQNAIYDYNSQLYHFHYQYSIKSIKVIKKTENGWSNFVSGWSIPEQELTQFNFQRFKMRDGSLSIGVGSQAVFNSFSIQHTEYIAYFCRDGRIYDQGQKRLNGKPILSDQNVTVDIDRANSVITWRSNSIQLGSASISSNLNLKKLYLIVKIFWKDDEFQLNFR